MPVSYQLDPGRGFLETCCAGDVTLEEVLDHFGSLMSDPALPERLDLLLDLGATRSAPETAQLRSVVVELERLTTRLRFGACAIVASTDALFGMSRMFEVFAEPYFARTRVFRRRAEAESWLASARTER